MASWKRQSSVSKCHYLFITRFPFGWLCGAFTFRIWRLKVTTEVTYSIPQLHKLAFNHYCLIDVCTLHDCQRRFLTSQLEIQTCLVYRDFVSITYIVLKSLELETNGPWSNFFHNGINNFKVNFYTLIFHTLRNLAGFLQYCPSHLSVPFLFEFLRLMLVTFFVLWLFFSFSLAAWHESRMSLSRIKLQI